MAFSTTSFFAGVGTVFAAVTIGFAGGAMITTSPKLEPNRLERVAASAPAVTPSAKAETPATRLAATPLASTPVATEAKTETPEPAPATDRVIAMAPAPSAQPSAPPQPQPVTAKDDGAPQIGSASKIREGELRREREKDSRMQRTERRAEARPQLRKRREIEAAANAVRQMQRDNAVQEVSQRDDSPRDGSPRLGFFGNE
jgi:hypothetical protein